MRRGWWLFFAQLIARPLTRNQNPYFDSSERNGPVELASASGTARETFVV